MFSRREMLDRKESIDGRSAQLKQTLREWRRQAATTGVYRSPDELAELERAIASLGRRSNKIQNDLALLNRERPDGNHYFARAAKELLTAEEFRVIADHATCLRKAAQDDAAHDPAPPPRVAATTGSGPGSHSSGATHSE